MKRLKEIRKINEVEDGKEVICVKYGQSEMTSTRKTQPHYVGVYSKDAFDEIVDILVKNERNIRDLNG